MNRLIACVVLGFGLTSGVVACGDDDDNTPEDTGGTSSAGTAAAGKSGGGSSSGGSSSGGSGGTGGNSGGSGGKGGGGSSAGGTAGSGVGGQAVGGEDGVGGENVGGVAGEGVGGEGAGGAPPEAEPQLPTPFWLANFCDAISLEELGCDKSPLWYTCYDPYSHFLSAGEPDGECIDDNEEFTKLQDTVTGFDNLAAACPDPTVEQFSCSLAGVPRAKDAACQDAFAAATAAYQACRPQGM